jgi:hypothetical protein
VLDTLCPADSASQRTIVTRVQRTWLDKPLVPTRLFTSEPEAIAWLRELVE